MEKRFWFLILLFFFVFRLPGLCCCPQWFWDEGANLEYASNLMEGGAEYFGYRYNFVPHPPAYIVLTSLLVGVLGRHIWVLRLFSVLCALGGLFFAVRLGQEHGGGSLGWFSGLVFAVFPELIFWNKTGYANNLLGLQALASIYFLTTYLKSGENRFLAYTVLVLGFACLTQYTAAVFVLAAFVVLYAKGQKSKSCMVFLFSISPLLLFAGYMVFFWEGFFLEDLVNYFSFYPHASAVALMVIFLFFLLKVYSKGLLRFFDYLSRTYESDETPADFVVYLLASLFSLKMVTTQNFFEGFPSAILIWCFIGLIKLRKSSLRDVLWVYTGVWFLALLSANRWDHMSIPLVYLTSLGAAVLVEGLWRRVKVFSEKTLLSPKQVKLLITLPLILILGVDILLFSFGGIGCMDVESLMGAIAYVNRNVGEGDLVVGMSYINQYLECETTIHSLSLAYDGVPFAYFRREYEDREFVGDISFSNAGYTIVPAGLRDYLKKEYPPAYNVLADFNVAYSFNLSNKKSHLNQDKDTVTEFLVLENPSLA
ncbi:MAG: hypothetical protein GF334_10860 [Candidatus Altiarchaeales archaeon]|nr:hypothetical protein [Candidatus Altiarchaeales archaeon]